MPVTGVTGASGFIGTQVAGLLAAKGHQVVPLSRSAAGVDLTDRGSLSGRLDDVDVVIHLAARAGGVGFQGRDDPRVFHENRAMTDTVLREAERAGVNRVFLASSGVVYRESAELLDETGELISAADSPSPYAWGKLTDEVVGRWYDTSTDVDVVIGRLANVYGPGGDADDDTGTVVHTLVRRAREAAANGKATFEVRGHPDSSRCFIHVADAARAIVLVATQGEAGNTYNIDTSRRVTMSELASVIAGAIPGEIAPVFEDQESHVPNHRATSNRKLRSLGFSPSYDLEDGVGRYVAALEA